MPVDVSVLTDCEATTAFDNFNYTENPISNSGKWTNQVLSGHSNLLADGTSVSPATTPSTDCSAYRNDTSWTTAVVGMLTITTKVGADDGLYGIYVGLEGAGLGSGTPNGYRGEIRIRVGGGADEWRIQIVNAGALSVLSSGTIQEIASGDKFAVVRTSGNAIELWWKSIGTGTWSFIVSTTDATYTAGGKVGVHINDVTAGTISQLEDLKVMNIVAASQALGAPPPPVIRVRLRAY